MIALLSLTLVHVPTYDSGCDQNCCKPPRHHTTSQVIYLKGSGGLEIHLKNDSTPIDYRNGEMVDFDVVFRDPIDPTTYALYIGCLGCVPSDPIAVGRTFVTGYQPATLEPFTQSVYRSAFPESERKFNSSLLDPSVCDQEHFAVRLVDFKNRSDGKPIIWGAVVGLGEKFEFDELLSFPIYVLNNHGDSWNEMSYTYWFSLFLISPLFLATWRATIRSMGGVPLDSNPISITMPRGGMPKITMRMTDPREPLYDLAILAFTAAAIEQLYHAVYWQFYAEFGWQFFTAISVALFSNGLGIAFVSFVWESMLFKRDANRIAREEELYGKRDREIRCKKCSGSAAWAPLEIATGFSFMLLFGAGFYLGPICIMISGFIRLFEVWPFVVPTAMRVRYEAVEPTRETGNEPNKTPPLDQLRV